jgi:hypothetical protein
VRQFRLGAWFAGGSVAGRVALAACLVAAVPRAAGAALSLGIQPELSCAPGEHSFDLVFTETNPAENEGLFAYDLAISYEPVGIGTGAGGFAFTGAEAPPDHFVLDVPSGSVFQVGSLTPSRLLINASSMQDLADIQTGDKAARIFYTIGAVPPAAYTLVFETPATNFGSADPDHDLDIPVDLQDFGIVVCPEPAALLVVLPAAAGALVLRRRRCGGSGPGGRRDCRRRCTGLKA